MKLFRRSTPPPTLADVAATFPKTVDAMKGAIKDAQLKAFREGWVDGCETALLMVLGSGGDDSYTGDVDEELRAYIMKALDQVRIEKKR